MTPPRRAPAARSSLALALLAAGGLACTRTADAAKTAAAPAPGAAEAQTLAQARAIFGPREPLAPQDPALVALGRRLFFETRASADGKVGCVSCHQPTMWATDGRPLAIGAFGRVNPRNSPTILDVSEQFVQHWRGDRESVEDQAQKALTGPPSFGWPSADKAMDALRALGYEPAFHAAFPSDPQPVSQKNWGTAIGAYERTLRTTSPFDAYLGGDAGALSPQAQRGLAKFIATGCITCHNGPNLGGRMYQKFGVLEDYWKRTGSAKVDAGRFDVTHQESDKYVFKVPRLRNVAKTGPYFHDGSVAELDDAVRIMAAVQLGKTLEGTDVTDLAAFLISLTGGVPANFSPPTEP